MKGRRRLTESLRQIQSAEEANLYRRGRDVGARYLEGEQIAWSRGVEEHGEKPPTPGRPGLALTREETPRVWGEPCQHASRRCLP